MSTSAIVAKYKVNEQHAIKVHYEFPSGGYFVIDLINPQWKPGSIVTIDEDMMDYIKTEMINYTRTGVSPHVGSDKTRL